MVEKNNKNKRLVALSSVFASAALTILKFIVGIATGSMGVISEAVHSALDFGAALLTYFAVGIGDKPPDKEHPYGHAKVESVAALIETGLLFITSVWIIYEAIQRLIFKTVEVKTTWYSIAVIIVSIIIDFSRSRALNKVAKDTRSQALEADALHFSSDILSSLAVLIGLLFVAVGFFQADAIAAIFVAIFVAVIGFRLGKRTIDVLIDAAPEGLTERVVEAAKKVEGVIDIERVRVRPVGAFIFVEMVINVSRRLPLETSQAISDTVENHINNLIPEADIAVQAKPLPLNNETIVEQVQIIVLNHNLSVHDIVVHTLENKKYISFDLEVDAGLTIKQAHQVASHIEKTIRDEIGDDIEINTHIEPLRSEAVKGKSVTPKEEAEINKIIAGIVMPIKIIHETHDIQIRKTGEKLFISLHCLFKDEVLLEEAHDVSTRLEYLIKEKVLNAQRIVVHAEPVEAIE